MTQLARRLLAPLANCHCCGGSGSLGHTTCGVCNGSGNCPCDTH